VDNLRRELAEYKYCPSTVRSVRKGADYREKSGEGIVANSIKFCYEPWKCITAPPAILYVNQCSIEALSIYPGQ